MAQKYTVDNIIESSRVYSLWTASSSELRLWTRDRISQLMQENKEACHDIIFSRMSNLFCAVAIHEYNLSTGMDEKESLDIIFDAMRHFVDPSRKNFEKYFSNKFVFMLNKPLLAKTMKRGNGKGFQSCSVKVRSGIGVDTTKCVYKSIVQDKYGYVEMGKRFCQLEEFMYGTIPNVKFVRTGTLCNGADRCDFRLYWEKGANKK